MLGNLRGSAYASGHGLSSRSQQQKWRFNLDDMGEYDVEALLALTQRVTGDARPFYLGYSSGGGALYTWLQRRPRAHHVLRGALLWTPSLFYTEPHSTILKIYNLLPEAIVRALWQVPGDILPRSRATADVAWRMCRSGSPLRNFCEALFQLGANINLDSTDMSACRRSTLARRRTSGSTAASSRRPTTSSTRHCPPPSSSGRATGWSPLRKVCGRFE
ncbi:lipase 3-like [Schistocerca gregaria]|uniref:lipase 3-like n=1 Tax=Schistocerca gregaria TaxID=7010 RepID=UPI00211F41EE|nr:lipase 3-like [Schistocerca gregaria]